MTVTTVIRTILYLLAMTTGAGTLGTAAGFVHEVNQLFLRRGYYPVSAELLAAGVLSIIVLPILHFGFHLRRVDNVVASLGLEVAVLFVLWALFLGGAAALTSDLGAAFNLRGCSQSVLCTLGRALEALAWSTWALLTLLLVCAVVFGLQTGVWSDSLDVTSRGGNVERWRSRASEQAWVERNGVRRSSEMTNV
ncbi:hypothetical protein JCM10212_001154 [Sporobolomyces blumeae]